ncbi:uncharacterized protein DDB_G0283357 [Hyalella azteca]|uniref:Uncharacterized protein DDB_G0283357 n=1 Tax=Hyalella azteca TaxID=294128 RepID=A0A8B7P6L7_HYAAZ|nr:uncharacterized protein DDB_G0283357 [Hyalella azteca]
MKNNPDRSGEDEGLLENGLPQPFVESMRTLFDILDDQHTGQVRFSDIEQRWHEDEDCSTSGLPAGVLESLRVVTPQDGYLSFSRFCKGLQICLLRSKSGNPCFTPTSLASSAQSSPSSGGENLRSNDSHRTPGNCLANRDELPPPVPPPPSQQAYPSPPSLPYHSHAGSSTNHSSTNVDMKRCVPHTANNSSNAMSGWSSQQPKPNSATTGLYSGTNNLYDVKKSKDGPIYQQNPSSMSIGKYHTNGYSNPVDNGQAKGSNITGSSQFRNSHSTNHGTSSNSIPTSPQKNSASNNNGHSNNEVHSTSRSGFGQVQKTDIRMGTGGMMSMYGNKGSSSGNSNVKSHMPGSSQGPPKPPRSLEAPNSESNLITTDKFNGKTNGSSSHSRQAYSGHRVDSIINKMEALSTYATSTNTNNNNLHKEKIYDMVASKNRRGISTTINGYQVTSNKSSSSSNQVHSYEGRNGHETTNYDHLSSERMKRGNSKPSAMASSSGGGRAPAALPLSAVLNGYSLQRSQTHSHITTCSLERDSRADTWRVSQETSSGQRMRTQRGGSLERLLDDHHSHNNHNQLLQPYHHHHPHGPSRHYHSRESSNDTSSTAPLHPYHSSADWSSPSTNQNWNSTSKSAYDAPPQVVMPSKNQTSNGETFNQRFQQSGNTYNQPQRLPQYPPQTARKPNPRERGSAAPFVANLAPNTSHKSSTAVKYSVVTGNSGGSVEVSSRRPSTDILCSPPVSNKLASGGSTSGGNMIAQPLTTTAGAVDNRLTMSSYAWIRGGEDTSSNSGDGGYFSSNPGPPVGPPAPSAAPVADTDEGGTAGSSSRGHKKSRRRDARRHTLQNGLDHATVRRAGQLEAERDMLHQGLQVVEQARQWYRTALHNLLYNLHHNTNVVQPYDSEAQQQKLHYQLARITEINSQLNALMSASDMPHHLALASSTSSAQGAPTAPLEANTSQEKIRIEGQVKNLKDQNHKLTEEVSLKNQHISVLEQDKSRLLRELFQARSLRPGNGQSNNQADSTFM